MANEYTYMQTVIPKFGNRLGETESQTIRWRFGGINRRDTIDTGEFADMIGISSERDELVTDPPFAQSTEFTQRYPNPIQVEAFSGFLLVLYQSDGGALMADILREGYVAVTITVNQQNDFGNIKRSVVLFNVCEMEDDNILTATFHPTILIFPDKYSFPALPESGSYASYLGDEFPNLTMATAFQGRLFGSDGSLAFASGYNDYANWNLDTADESSPANAWVTATQTNVYADDNITAVTVYGGHVVLFKHGYMHEIYGTENPFRLYDVGEYGCVGARALAQVGGILYFASTGGIMAYNGSSVSCISRDVILGGETLPPETVLSGDFRYLYVNTPVISLRYDTVWNVWTRQPLPEGFVWHDVTANRDEEGASYILSDDGNIYVPSGNVYREWHCETDMIAMSSVDIRRVKKLTISGTCFIPEGTGYVKLYLLHPGEEFGANSQLIAEKTFSGAKKPFTIRAMVRMTADTAHRLVLVGYGAVTVTSIAMKISWGGERYDTE